jgi:hypothetical protein
VSARLASSGLRNQSQPRTLAAARCQRETGKYGLELLGEPLRASTLAELFGALIDRLAELDPEAVEKLSTMRSTKRGFVSREKNAIHPGRPDLPLRRTRSGWWISANIGTEDLERALRRTREANDLVYCRDIRFLRPQRCGPSLRTEPLPEPAGKVSLRSNSTHSREAERATALGRQRSAGRFR